MEPPTPSDRESLARPLAARLLTGGRIGAVLALQLGVGVLKLVTVVAIWLFRAAALAAQKLADRVTTGRSSG